MKDENEVLIFSSKSACVRPLSPERGRDILLNGKYFRIESALNTALSGGWNTD